MKKAFTLIEVLVSVLIASFIVYSLFFSYRSLERLKNENSLQLKNVSLKSKMFYALNEDILLSDYIKVDNGKKNSALFLRTSNSFFQIPDPYVCYLVVKKDSALIRLESVKPFSIPVDPLLQKYIFIQKIDDNVSLFKIEKEQDHIKVYINSKNLKDFSFNVPILNYGKIADQKKQGER